MVAVHENGILKKKLQSMTVLHNGIDETAESFDAGQVDKAQVVTNWISDEVAKFDGRQEEALQHLNEISVQRKLESERNVAAMAMRSGEGQGLAAVRQSWQIHQNQLQ